MQRQSLFDLRSSACQAKVPDRLRVSRFASMASILACKHQQHIPGIWLSNASIFLTSKNLKIEIFRPNNGIQAAELKESTGENLAESPDENEDDELCPVECAREFKSDNEFYKILEKAKERNTLIMEDFYRIACGSCKYIEHGFAKLCKRSGDQKAPVIFLKHNKRRRFKWVLPNEELK